MKVTGIVPAYDAPGAWLPVVVTAKNAVAFDARLDKTPGQCEGETWTHSRGVSQLCWVTLPKKAGRYTLTVRAQLTSGSSAALSQTVKAKGPVDEGIDAATRDQVQHCGNTSRDVWLTFDDKFLSERALHSMLKVLDEKNVRGRFFALGSWSREHPEMVKELTKAGHLVENHTDTHEPLNTLDDKGLQSQIDRGPNTKPTLLRPGYGAGAFTRRVADAARKDGQQVCYWTVDSQDWTGASADVMIQRVLKGDYMSPPARPGGNVLFHMTGKHTTQALPELIDRLRAEGMTLPALH